MPKESISWNKVKEDIEGLIFKNGAKWIAVFAKGTDTFRCEIDYCPFCGKDLNKVGEHSH